MRFIFIFLTMFASFALPAQKEVNIWHFGYEAGLNFNFDPPRVLTDGKLNTSEGCASICDKNGKLLMYTDGITVYNNRHGIMANGTDLHGHSSSAQSALIVQLPESDSIYYIFNPGELTGLVQGFFYSIVNIRADGGKGEVIKKNVTLRGMNRSESVSAVRHANNRDIWVVFKDDTSSGYLSYLVTPAGISSKVVISNPGPAPDPAMWGGYIKCGKFSAAGDKYALTFHSRGVCLYDFNNATGMLSNLRIIPSPQPYGVEFSPDGSKLYVSSWSASVGIAQYDVSSGSLATILLSYYPVTQTKAMGALQIGPDKKIYVVRNGSRYLNVIFSPNLGKSACDYKEDFIYLSGKMSGVGLPPFMSTYFREPLVLSIKFTGKCISDSFRFESLNLKIDDSVEWDFGDPSSGVNNVSTLKTPFHVYSIEDTFFVRAFVYVRDVNKAYVLNKILKKTVIVSGYSGRAKEYPLSLKKCPHDSVILDALNKPGISKVNWNDLPGNIPTRHAKHPGLFIATVYRNGSGCYFMDSIQVNDMKYVLQPKLGHDTVYCHPYGSGISESLGISLPQGYTYQWNTGEKSRTILAGKSGDYSVSLVKAGECPLSDTISVTMSEFPLYRSLLDTMMCRDEPVRKIALTASGYESISWSTGDTGRVVTVGLPGNYSYAVSNRCGSLADSFNVNLIDVPVVDLGKDLTVCPVHGFELKSNVPGAVYRWMPNGETTESVVFYQVGSISLEVKNQAGCIGKDEIVIRDSCREECFLPDAFSPNGDGLNDAFMPYGNDLRGNAYEFRVYNRWGEQVFETRETGSGWDGTFDHEPCMSGVYFYTVEYLNAKKQKINLRGTFTLLN
jgi:gliding motility-associated-like protein